MAICRNFTGTGRLDERCIFYFVVSLSFALVRCACIRKGLGLGARLFLFAVLSLSSSLLGCLCAGVSSGLF